MMKKYYYDFHIHSCLSPCADDDNTPNNIAGMAQLCGLNMIALTDHNTCKNCPAFFEACERYGITAVAGLELNTAEEIHVICLFEKLSDALGFDKEIEKHRILIENRTDIFGNQFILDGSDNVIGEDKYLLSNATDISLEDVKDIVEKYSGICYPAHIDRQSNGIISVLGTFPATPEFNIVEFNSMEKAQEISEKYNLQNKRIIISSDAHQLTAIKDKENFIELDTLSDSADDVRHSLFEYLKSK